MTPSKDTISVQSWLTDSSVAESARFTRKQVLAHWAKANERETSEQLLDDIKSERITVYSTARKMTDYLRDQLKLKPSTVTLYRALLPGFFESVLGEENIKRTVYDRLVPAGDNFVTQSKASPKVEELRHMLRLASPRDKALVAVLCSTGMRIGEAVSRKMSDLERRPWGGARIKLQVMETKARTKRYVFLTPETLGWIDSYHVGLNIEGAETWVFPGEKGRHVDKRSMWLALKTLFRRAGLQDSEDEIYSAHSFRTFADKVMSKGGLDRKYVALIIGHKSKLASEINYKDWNDIEECWVEASKHRDFTWGTEKVEVIVSNPKLEKKVQALEEFNKKLLVTLLGATGATIEGKDMTLEQRIERAKQLLLEDKSKDEVGTGA